MVDQGRLREVSWLELFPWLRIVSALRLAFSPSLLVLGAIGIVATIAGWSVIGGLPIYEESEDATTRAIATSIDDWPWERPLDDRGGIPEDVEDIYLSPFLTAWRMLSAPFGRMFDASLTFRPFTLVLAL